VGEGDEPVITVNDPPDPAVHPPVTARAQQHQVRAIIIGLRLHLSMVDMMDMTRAMQTDSAKGALVAKAGCHGSPYSLGCSKRLVHSLPANPGLGGDLSKCQAIQP
jgi:hypothetical protein